VDRTKSPSPNRPPSETGPLYDLLDAAGTIEEQLADIRQTLDLLERQRLGYYLVFPPGIEDILAQARKIGFQHHWRFTSSGSDDWQLIVTIYQDRVELRMQVNQWVCFQIPLFFASGPMGAHP
jgi:hypothetical protein